MKLSRDFGQTGPAKHVGVRNGIPTQQCSFAAHVFAPHFSPVGGAEEATVDVGFDVVDPVGALEVVVVDDGGAEAVGAGLDAAGAVSVGAVSVRCALDDCTGDVALAVLVATSDP